MAQKQHTIMDSEARLLRISEVSKLTSLSKSCINLWVSKNKFPEPITLCPTVKVWRFNDIVVWIDEQSFKSKNQAADKESANVAIKSIDDAVEDYSEKPLLKIVHG
jgi:predicted DNA-binding transcriptional regulator AlpA